MTLIQTPKRTFRTWALIQQDKKVQGFRRSRTSLWRRRKLIKILSLSSKRNKMKLTKRTLKSLSWTNLSKSSNNTVKATIYNLTIAVVTSKSSNWKKKSKDLLPLTKTEMIFCKKLIRRIKVWEKLKHNWNFQKMTLKLFRAKTRILKPNKRN